MVLRGEPNLRFEFHTMHHQISAEAHVSGNREAFTNDDRWKANWWTTSWWEKSRWKWNDQVCGFFCFRISHPRCGKCCVCDGRGYTHTLCRTRTFLTHFPCVAHRHPVHAWLKMFAVRMPHLSISPSPFSCFIRRLCGSRTVTSRPHSCLYSLCQTVPDPKARVERTSARAGSLATWPIPRAPHNRRSRRPKIIEIRSHFDRP